MRQSRTRRRLGIALAALGVLAVAATGCSSQPSAAFSPRTASGELQKDTAEKITRVVERAMAATGSSGAIVGVWVPWAGSLVTGVGSSEKGTKASPEMSFRIGDLTRPMTCDVLYGMADDGVVKLNDPVTKYVPTVSDLDGVTLQQLCDSSSGLGSSEPYLLGSWLSTPERVWDPRSLASYGLGEERLTPGSAYRESDAGYLILGEALENAAQRGARDLLDDYVFRPLGLRSTSLPPSRAAVPDTSGSTLRGYYSSQEDVEQGCAEPTDITELSSSIGFTDSGVVSTMDDLGRYAQALAQNGLGSKHAENRWKGALPIDPAGAAWDQYTGGAYVAGPLIGQQGAIPGYLASMYSDPKSGLTVAVALNNSTAGPAIAGYAARELAALAAKTPPAKGQKAPELALPWTYDTYHDLVAEAAICPLDD